MCTVTWLRERGGYMLLCNRDELLSRKPAVAPAVKEHRGVRFIAPEDGDHGGAWIAVNQFALSVCLLNRYQDSGTHGTNHTSRGLLLLDMAKCSSGAEVLRRVCAVDLVRFQPFILLALEPDRDALVIEWTGSTCSIRHEAESAMPLSSSSYKTPSVIEARRNCFERLTDGRSRLDAATLFRFHANHSPGRSAYSPCVHREDARTVSFSWIKATRDAVEFRYHADSPCTIDPASLLVNEIRRKQLQFAGVSILAEVAYRSRASRLER
jgi:uncharacterized protein with NRDE domain